MTLPQVLYRLILGPIAASFIWVTAGSAADRGPLLPFPLDWRHVVAAQLPMRDRPDYRGTVIATLKKDDTVQIVDRVGSWLMVRLADNRLGYVHQRHITVPRTR